MGKWSIRLPSKQRPNVHLYPSFDPLNQQINGFILSCKHLQHACNMNQGVGFRVMNNLVVSPCCNPEMDLETALSTYAEIGYSRLEAFTSWVKSALDYNVDPAYYLNLASKYGMSYYSVHLPRITDDLEASVKEAVKAAHFAAALGAEIVLYKADSREACIRGAKLFLDATQHLPVTPVLQNHVGTPIETIADFRDVINGIADPRMKTLLEVGHFHSVGVTWREGYELLGESIALIHIKDQIGTQSVAFGAGEVDLPGLFAQMKAAGYTGKYVVEFEVKDRENTLKYLRDGLEYLRKIN